VTEPATAQYESDELDAIRRAFSEHGRADCPRCAVELTRRLAQVSVPAEIQRNLLPPLTMTTVLSHKGVANTIWSMLVSSRRVFIEGKRGR
jgi:hypothetical protein